jgi:CheY-like chemotaxis protein
MRTPRTILIVEADLHALFGLLEVVRAAGYECAGAATYEAGREQLSSRSFDLAVVNAHVGPKNGLHLIRQSRLLYPGMETIVLTSVDDEEARAEARRYGAPSLDLPAEPRRLVALAGRLLSQLAHRRRWVRKRVTGRKGILVDQQPASLVDVCYGGVRFEIAGRGGEDLPPVMRLSLPSIDEALLVSLVWADRAVETGRLCCGATVLSTNGPAFQAWREMVDTLPALPRSQAPP